MALQGFVDKRPPVVGADWLNSVDFIKITYDRTAAEQAAGITITAPNSGYPPGNVKRYGGAVNGVTADNNALNAAYAQFKQGGPPPFWDGVCLVTQVGATGVALTWDADIILNGNGRATLIGDGVNNYMLLLGSGNGKVDIRGVTFDGAKGSPTRPSANNDYGIKLTGGSYTTVNIEDCIFRNFNDTGLFSHSAMNQGGRFHHNNFNNIAGFGFYMDRGQYIEVTDNVFTNIFLQPVSAATLDNVTTMRVLTIARNFIIGGGTSTTVIDRAGIFVSHKPGAASTVMGDYLIADNHIRDFGVGYGGGMLVLGIETRDGADFLVRGNCITGVPGVGLYSFQTTRASYIGNQSNGNTVGINMNSCVDYTEKSNVCLNSTSGFDRDYVGATTPNTFVQAEGLSTVYASCALTNLAGVPAFSANYAFASVVRNGVGNYTLNFSRAIDYTGYQVIASLRSSVGQIESATHAGGSFVIITTDSAGANFDPTGIDLQVVGRMVRTNPA